MKKIVSILTSIVMTVTVFSGILPVNAQETTSQTAAIENDISIEGTNSFGNLISKEFTEKTEEQQENNGCNVFSAEVTGKEVKVSFETTQNCTLLAAVYDESGEQMLASGNAEVTNEETEKTVTIETDSMPKYFYLRVFLIDSEEMSPLCTVYESPNYTKEMQDFFAKTVDDFDSEKVLNLDNDKTNNFAVFSDETKIIKQNGDVNKVTKADDTNNQYVIENADSSVTSLVSGDTFAYEYENKEVLIVKIASIEISGTTATITGQDTSMEDVFDYVKIETDQGIDDAVIDDSNLEEGVTYEGLVEDNQKSAQGYAVDVSGSTGVSASFKIAEKKIGSDDNYAKVTGNVDINFEASVKIYISFKQKYLELNLTPSAEIAVTISGQLKGAIKLGFIGFSPVPGVIIELTPSFVVEASAELTISGKLSFNLGFRVDSKSGYKSLNSTPKFETQVQVEGTIFIGFSLEPKIKIISDKIAKVGLEAKAGAEIKATLTGGEMVEEKQHICKKCIDGDINGKLSIAVEAKLANLKKLTWKHNIAELTIKIFDFHYSFDFNEFALKPCSHYEVPTEPTNEPTTEPTTAKTTAEITTEPQTTTKPIIINSNKIKEISLGENHSGAITQNGSLYMWGYNENGQLGNGESGYYKISSTPIKIMDNVKSVNLGDYHSGALTENGSLYMWGGNYYNYSGLLGNGTEENSSTPIKIMDNVKAIGLGNHHSAAITNDGSLYMWGYNKYCQLGNGTSESCNIPIKIMNNVRSVSLGESHSAAITEDGSLYMWGLNENGQVGNGTTEYSIKFPTKIMDNVKSVSLGNKHSAAITEDGSLYMWGYNYDGELGNGKSGGNRNNNKYDEDIDSCTPIKIMDNVKDVSLGYYHSGAITEDGSLYTWGYNDHGQLGNITTNDNSTPTKIMSNVKSIIFGNSHSSAISEDGSLYMWGRNNYGQLGSGTTADSLVPIEINITDSASESAFSLDSSKQAGQNLNASEESTSKTVEFNELKPNTIYNFYSAKANKDEDKNFNQLSSENLLYINQYTSDENGNLKITYKLREEYTDIAEFVVSTADRSDNVNSVDNKEDNAVKGDANQDGKLNIRDAALIARKAAEGKLSELPECADFNEDGKVNVRDAAAIARFLASKV